MVSEPAAALRVFGAVFIIAALAVNVYNSHQSGLASNPAVAIRLSRQFYSFNLVIVGAAAIQVVIIAFTAVDSLSLTAYTAQVVAGAILLVNTFAFLQSSGAKMVAYLEKTAAGAARDDSLMRRFWITRWVSYTVNAAAAMGIAFSFML